MMREESSRRGFLALTAALGAAFGACGGGEDAPTEAPSRLGAPVSGYGERSRFETSRRYMAQTKTPEQAASLTPLEESEGIITPSALHFERHHAGIPAINPDEHELLIHGLVERPLRLTMADLRRLPSTSVIRFIECSGNSRSEWTKPAPTAQISHGMASCSEWTGVSLRLLLDEAGLKPEARWMICEGADACRMARSLPIEKLLEDCMVVYGQNGEALRPEQGYPLRLLVPGWEGNVSVKWLRVLKATAGPGQTRDETSKYTDLMPNGEARQFTFDMEAKSLITSPSGGQKLPGSGFYEIRGLAWSGRGLIEKVEVSTDGGSSWQEAELQEPRFPKAFTRFRLPWRWEGGETSLVCRAIDETGYVQPTVEELVAVRGTDSSYHNNGTKAWKVAADGSVTNV